jgi:flagellar motor switch protein FliN/FliY
MGSELIPHPRTLGDELAGELAAVLGALLGVPGTATPVPDRVDAGWVVSVQLHGTAAGAVSMGFADADAATLARAVMGVEEEPQPTVVLDMLRETAAQVVSALGQRPVARGLELSVQTPRRLDGSIRAPEGEAVSYRLALTPEVSPTVVFWLQVERAITAASPAVAHAGTPAARGDARTSATAAAANLDVILDIDLPLSVRFGETELTLDALTRLGPGSMIDLGRSPDEPVDVLVNGRLIARGEVVVVAGNYGVRIIEILSAADRVRSLGT